MRPLGIKYQILLITLIPVLLIDFFFTYTNINTNIEQATELLQSKGQIIARQLAGASEFNLFTGNDQQIQYLLDQSVDTNDIVLASVYDSAGGLIAQSTSTEFDRSETTNYFYYRQPILSQSVLYADVFSPDSAEEHRTTTLGWVHLYISRQQLLVTMEQIILDSITFFVLFLIMAIILTVVISRRITRPIFRLMEHLRDVENGQLGNSIEPVEANEIGAVQKGFNRMTHALLANRGHLNQRIQQATQQLNEAITDLETRNRELGFARDEAQNANRTKSEFLANMSHEIRTPINGIKGFISLLGQSELNETQQRYVDIVDKSTSDLTKIVNEILEFSKLESGKLHIIDEGFDLYEVIEQTRDILFINALTKNIDLNLIIFSDVPRWVTGDKLRLKQILLNLMGNAIKFTDRGGVIIRVLLEDQIDDKVEIVIRVEDSGIGISSRDQRNLFQAFTQVDSANNRQFSGTGLGLAISKNLANLMGGDITLQSTPGKGSIFTLNLPLVVTEDPQPDSPDIGLSAFILAANETCLMETRTLYDRAGVVTEGSLIESEAEIENIAGNVRRNLPYLDLLVFDMRNLKIDVSHFIDVEMHASLRIIAMGYDHEVQPDQIYGLEFISIVNTSHRLQEILTRDHQLKSQRPGESGGPALTGAKHVLLVDDNEVNLKLASELIQLWGHRVTEAEHGNLAFDYYCQQDFDLIILDIQMPDIDGATLLQMMREHKPDDTTPIVAMTANILNDEAERLLELGFDYYLSKPIDEKHFRALIDGHPSRKPKSVSSTDFEDADSDRIFDYQRSLALAAGNQSLLRQILDILQRDIPDHQRELNEASQAKDRDRLGAIAHKLHGVTCYASLPRLRRKVVELQKRLSREESLPPNDAIAEIIEELSEINQEVERLLTEPAH